MRTALVVTYLAGAEDDPLVLALLWWSWCPALGHDAGVVHDQPLEAHTNNALQYMCSGRKGGSLLLVRCLHIAEHGKTLKAQQGGTRLHQSADITPQELVVYGLAVS